MRKRVSGRGGVEESSSISNLLRHSSAQQCYYEMKMIYAPQFSILSSIILWLYCITVGVWGREGGGWGVGAGEEEVEVNSFFSKIIFTEA